MLAFREKDLAEVKAELQKVKTLGIVSCGGCPALQKKGGTVGVERWKNFLKDEFEIKWALVAPYFCDERLLKVHMAGLGENLTEVDAVLVMVCDAGAKVAVQLLGFDCIQCLETLFFGVMKENGQMECHNTLKETVR